MAPPFHREGSQSHQHNSASRPSHAQVEKQNDTAQIQEQTHPSPNPKLPETYKNSKNFEKFVN